ICLDTCHVHDAGYNLNELDALLDHFDEVLGLDLLQVIHLNDSKNVQGAAKDRHANLGDGEIGFDPLYKVAHHPKLKHVIKILETPYIDGVAPYKAEIDQLLGR
ncbi:MAG: TIM barrel protein, partial [Erysipelotrichaceae bacterium]